MCVAAILNPAICFLVFVVTAAFLMRLIPTLTLTLGIAIVVAIAIAIVVAVAVATTPTQASSPRASPRHCVQRRAPLTRSCPIVFIMLCTSCFQMQLCERLDAAPSAGSEAQAEKGVRGGAQSIEVQGLCEAEARQTCISKDKA